MALNKQQLIAEVAKRAGLKKADAAAAITHTFESIKDELAKHGTVRLINFGTFGVIHKKERTGINPRDPKKSIKIPARYAPKFSPGKALKAAVNPSGGKGGKKKK